jgi:hypothetical protein
MYWLSEPFIVNVENRIKLKNLGIAFRYKIIGYSIYINLPRVVYYNV